MSRNTWLKELWDFLWDEVVLFLKIVGFFAAAGSAGALATGGFLAWAIAGAILGFLIWAVFRAGWLPFFDRDG